MSEIPQQQGRDSFLLAEKKTDALQPALFDFSEEDVLEFERKGVTTGERLFQQRPKVYKAVVAALAEGTIGIRAICRAFNVHPNTVHAVMDREKISIETLKTQTINNLRKVAALGSERLMELVNDGSVKPGELAILLGVTVDKLQLLQGEATSRVEHVQAPSHDDINSYIDSLPSANAVEITGSGGEKNDLKGGENKGLENGLLDIKSIVYPHSSLLMRSNDTAFDTERPFGTGLSSQDLTGGAGVSETGGGLFKGLVWVQQNFQQRSV